jgi:hypothetical protein
MIPRGLARLCSLAAAMSIASPCKSGVWGTQPVVGLLGDYSSNPALLNLPNTAESHAALLLDAPTTYVADAFKLSLLPSFRLSNSQGYSSLDSDYAHFNVSGEFDTEPDTVIATAALARDSSLYHDLLLSGSTGVRRDAITADLNWDRQLTERYDFDTDVDSTRVRYGVSAGVSPLTDYKYSSLNVTTGWAQSERGKLTVTAVVGRYTSLDGSTQSKNTNLQLGFTEKLSEIWTLAASAGYSRANNQILSEQTSLELTDQGPEVVLTPVLGKSTQNGSVYSLNLSRQTPLLTVTAIAARTLAPTGFAFLSRQDTYQLKATYNLSERWGFTGDVHRVAFQQPDISGAGVDFDTTYLQFSASWRWTESWTLTISATRVMEHYIAPSLDIASSGISVEFSRQFDWKSLQ